MSVNSTEIQLRELFQFLHDSSPQVRQIALSNLVGHTPKGSSHRDIFFAPSNNKGKEIIPEGDVFRDLKILCRDRLEIAHDSFRALINLSDSSSIITLLSELSFLSFIVSYIIHPPSILADLASMLLSNLTVDAAVCKALVSMEIPIQFYGSGPQKFYPIESRSVTSQAPDISSEVKTSRVLALPLLVNAFAEAVDLPLDTVSQNKNRKANLHFLSSVFANISATNFGRDFFLTPCSKNFPCLHPKAELEYPLAQLVVFTEHKDTIRRGGVTSTIKNCCFDTKAHRILLSSDNQIIISSDSEMNVPGINILPYVLLPLAGPEEYDLEEQECLLPELQFLSEKKMREADPVLRLTHTETLLLLATTRWGRGRLRSSGVYEIVKMMHENEVDDKISETIERLVNLLKRDEAPYIQIEDDGRSTTQEPDGYKNDNGYHPVLSVMHLNDERDEDNRIEEI